MLSSSITRGFRRPRRPEGATTSACRAAVKRSLRLLILCAASLPFFAAAAFAISLTGEFPVSSPSIEPAPFARVEPQIASNGDGFLVAWAEYRTPCCREIRAARVTSAGELIDATALKVDATTDTFSVTSSGRDYLVAYGCQRTGEPPSSCITLIPSAGGPIAPSARVAGAQASIACTTDGCLLVVEKRSNSAPAVLEAFPITPEGRVAGDAFAIGGGPGPAAIAASRDRYLVLWSADGSLRAVVSGPAAALTAQQDVTSTTPQSRPAALGWAAASDGRDFVAVWQQSTGLSGSAYVTAPWSRTISADGALGEIRPLGDAAEEGWRPNVAWTGSAYTASFIRFHRPATSTFVGLDTDGEPRLVSISKSGQPGPVQNHQWATATSVVIAASRFGTFTAARRLYRDVPPPMCIACSSASQASGIEGLAEGGEPFILSRAFAAQTDVSARPSGGSFMTAWAETVGEQQKRELRINLATPAASAPLRVSDSEKDQLSPAIGVSAIAWVEQPFDRNAGAVAVVKRLASDGTPTGSAIELGPAARDSRLTMATAGATSLVAWTSPQYSILAVRLSADGTPLDRTPLVLSPDLYVSYTPIAATDGTSFFVIWRVPGRCWFECSPPHSIFGTGVTTAGAIGAVGLVLAEDALNPAVVWNGSEYVVFATQNDFSQFDTTYRLIAKRVDRDGFPLLQPPVVIKPPPAPGDPLWMAGAAVWTGAEYMLPLRGPGGLALVQIDAGFTRIGASTLSTSAAADADVIAVRHPDGHMLFGYPVVVDGVWREMLRVTATAPQRRRSATR